jgi:hypothetical protein
LREKSEGITMTDVLPYMTQQEILERIRTTRAGFARLWEGLTEAQMVQRPGPQSDWSVKDLIAHIIFWETFMTRSITAILHSEAPLPSDDYDTINARVFEENKDRALADVLTQFKSNLADAEQVILNLTDEAINDPNHFPKRSGRPVINLIYGNTFGHYEEHAPDLKRYVDSLML